MKEQPKTKLQPKLDSVVHIRQPMVRDYSTAGGHHREHPITKDKIIAGLKRT